MKVTVENKKGLNNDLKVFIDKKTMNSYMEQKSVKILLDSKNILIGRNDLNLTNDVLIEINKKVK